MSVDTVTAAKARLAALPEWKRQMYASESEYLKGREEFWEQRRREIKLGAPNFRSTQSDGPDDAGTLGS